MRRIHITGSRTASVSKSELPVLFAAILLAAGASCPSRAEDAAAGQTALERFKHFMASPAIMQSLLYRKVMAGGLEKGLRVDRVVGTNDSVTYGYCRWQPDYLYLKLGTNRDVMMSGRKPAEEFDAQLGDEFWTVERSGLTTHWRDPVRNREAVRMRPSRMFQHRSDDFRQVMNMGVMHLDLGSVKWEGNRFAARGYIPELPGRVEVRGALRSTEDAHPKEMEVEYRVRQKIIRYVLRYAYSTNMSSAFLPSTIDGFLVHDGKETRLVEFDLLKVDLSATNLGLSLFDPHEIVQANSMPPLYYKDGGLYATNALGKLAPLRPRLMRDRLIGYREKFDLNQFYYGAVVLSAVAALSTLWRINNKNKQRKESII